MHLYAVNGMTRVKMCNVLVKSCHYVHWKLRADLCTGLTFCARPGPLTVRPGCYIIVTDGVDLMGLKPNP